MLEPDNDNRPLARHVPIVGFIAGDGEVTITAPNWRPQIAGALPATADLFPADPREP